MDTSVYWFKQKGSQGEPLRNTVSSEVHDSLFVAESVRAFRKVIEVEHRTHASLGYHSTVYDRASLEAILGSRTYQGGIRYAGTFGMNSFAFCRALRSALADQGVRIFEGTPVTRLTARGVETAGGAVTARSVAVLTDYPLPALGVAGRSTTSRRSSRSPGRSATTRFGRYFPEIGSWSGTPTSSISTSGSPARDGYSLAALICVRCTRHARVAPANGSHENVPVSVQALSRGGAQR